MALWVPISVGELFDKISILEIKAEVITDAARQANVMRQLDALDAIRAREIAASPELAALYAELQAVNRSLWRVEEDIRAVERAGRFDDGFIALARRVYRENDRRSALKRHIDELTGSEIVEEKSYL